MNTMDLNSLDRQFIWHPFTQEKIVEKLIVITKAKGSYLFNDKNEALLDLISSWWVNIHGHAHPQISQAIYDQCVTLEHVIFAGFTHKPAITLCNNLSQILPATLSKYFFSDNGSTAVEVALKMAFQYWKNKGCTTRTTFLSLEGAYHGDTFGSMSVGLASGYHNTFADLCFNVNFLPYPSTWMNDPEVNRKEEHSIQHLKNTLLQQGLKIAALIVEPLVQGAAGFRMVRPSFIQKIVNIVRDDGILVIFDEVMTGFGRTGTIFAMEQAGVVPDFICLSKGLTGGFVPLALTVTTKLVYDAFLDDNVKKAFAHGHSYTANPVACAAAIASLEILKSEETQKSIQKINLTHEKMKLKLVENEKVSRIRVRGTIAAFDVAECVNLEKFRVQCLTRGIVIRPLNRTVYIMPPYSTTVEELENAYSIILEILST